MAIHYTRSEALLNTWSHAAGILLGAVTGTLLLMMCAGSDDGWAGTGVVLYLAGMLASYIASTLYHAMPECYCRLKERLRKLDHAAIYWHIAGSYSPLTLIALRHEGLWGWVLFVFIWSCALAGTMMSFRRLREHSNIETMCLYRYGHQRACGIQAADKQRESRRRMVDCCRGRVLHHRCSVLQPQQTPLHAQRIPFLCSRRLRLSHHCRMGRAHAVFVKETE